MSETIRLLEAQRRCAAGQRGGQIHLGQRALIQLHREWQLKRRLLLLLATIVMRGRIARRASHLDARGGETLDASAPVEQLERRPVERDILRDHPGAV